MGGNADLYVNLWDNPYNGMSDLQNPNHNNYFARSNKYEG